MISPLTAVVPLGLLYTPDPLRGIGGSFLEIEHAEPRRALRMLRGVLMLMALLSAPAFLLVVGAGIKAAFTTYGYVG